MSYPSQRYTHNGAVSAPQQQSQSSGATNPYQSSPGYNESAPPLYTAMDTLSLEQAPRVPGSYPVAQAPTLPLYPFPSSAGRERNAVRSSDGRNASHNGGSQRPSRSPAPITQNNRPDLEKVHIAVMGVTGAGKSKFIQLCTDSREVKVGHGLRSCTNEVGEYEFVYRDMLICLIDTPGFDDTSRTDRAVLDDIATWLGTAYTQKVELAGILYLHRVTDVRMGGVAFDNLKMFKKLCGPAFFPRVTLTTTMWDIVDKTTAKKREAELLEEDDFWRRMRDGGCNIERHWGDRESAMDILKGIIRNRRKVNAPTFVQVQREMVDEKLNLDDTAAGREVNAKIEQERAKFQKDLEKARKEMQEAIEEHDSRSAELYRKQQQELEMKLRRGYDDQEKMKVKLEDLQRQHIEQFAEMESKLAESRAELEAARAEIEQQRKQLRNINPGSSKALVLREQIAEKENYLNDTAEDVARQEEAVLTKKKKLIPRLYTWIKENPNAVARGGMIFMQFANAAIAAARRREVGYNSAIPTCEAGDHSRWRDSQVEYEVEELDE